MSSGPIAAGHISVMKEEVCALAATVPSQEGLFIDATIGAGGHAEALLAEHPSWCCIGIDADPDACERTRARLTRLLIASCSSMGILMKSLPAL